MMFLKKILQTDNADDLFLFFLQEDIFSHSLIL